MAEIVNDISAKLFLPFTFREHPEFKQAYDAWEAVFDPKFRQFFNSPEVVRPLLKISPMRLSYKAALKNLQGMMLPEIENTIKATRQSLNNKLSDTDDSFLFMRLIIEQDMRKDTKKDISAKDVANRCMVLREETFGPIVAMVASMVFEVMRHQSYIEPLQEELNTALEVSGGEWSFDIFKHTPKLESYTQEIFRLYPVSSSKLILTNSKVEVELNVKNNV